MPDYIVSGEQLTAIANAIREKTGNTGSLTFPGGFTEGISGIETGGSVDALVNGSMTEINSNATVVKDNAFYSHSTITSVNFPKAKSIGQYAFFGCTALTSVNFPLVTDLDTGTFYGCSNLRSVSLPVYAKTLPSSFCRECSKLSSVNLPLVSDIGAYSFYKCSNLVKVCFPKASQIVQNGFYGCSKLTTADFPTVNISIQTRAFYDCSALSSLILRSSNMPSLEKIDAFTRTKIASGTGYIYVPAALVDTYKTATNWSTYANQFRALEDYTVDGTTTGELDSTKI